MPHLIIESSLSIPSKVAEELHKLVGDQETVSIEAVKTRVHTPTISFAGSQSGQMHTAITLKLLSGRSPELKEQMAANIYCKASELIQEGTVSVEIVDLGVYKK